MVKIHQGNPLLRPKDFELLFCDYVTKKYDAVARVFTLATALLLCLVYLIGLKSKYPASGAVTRICAMCAHVFGK
jgi:hypothetical protein